MAKDDPNRIRLDPIVIDDEWARSNLNVQDLADSLASELELDGEANDQVIAGLVAAWLRGLRAGVVELTAHLIPDLDREGIELMMEVNVSEPDGDADG